MSDWRDAEAEALLAKLDHTAYLTRKGMESPFECHARLMTPTVRVRTVGVCHREPPDRAAFVHAATIAGDRDGPWFNGD